MISIQSALYSVMLPNLSMARYLYKIQKNIYLLSPASLKALFKKIYKTIISLYLLSTKFPSNNHMLIYPNTNTAPVSVGKLLL